MATYNVSRRESEKLGIPRVLVGGSSKSSSLSSGGGGTGGGSSSSKSGYNFNPDLSTLKDLQKQYMGTFTPTAEETAQSQQLQNIMQGRDLGIQASRDRAIESGLVRGEVQSKMNTAQIQSQPLIDRLAQLQSQRQAQQQGLGALIGYENLNLDRQLQASQYSNALAQQAWERDMAERQLKASQAKSSGGGGLSSSSALNLTGWEPWKTNQQQSTIPVNIPLPINMPLPSFIPTPFNVPVK